MPVQTSGGLRPDNRDPQAGPVEPRRRRRRSTGCAPSCPAGSLIGGAVAENHDLQNALSAKTPLVIGVVMALGFLLLLIALQAPLLAAAGVLTNLLATGAAFGVAKWVFQDGELHSLLGFQPQGFLDAWGPVFFFAMIFAISMDYTVFLLSAAKEHWDHTHDPRAAMVGGIAHSGRVIFAAAAVMVAVFFTFALSGPLPPKEMGVILGVAVLLDAALVRLLLLPVLLRLMGGQPGISRPGPGGSCPTSPSDTHDPPAMARNDPLKLWQTEWCPASQRVRQRLTELGLTYTIHQVPVRAEDRNQLREQTGETSIPVLVADGQPVGGETAIMSYLDSQFPEPPNAPKQREKAAMAKRKQLERECPQLTATTA